MKIFSEESSSSLRISLLGVGGAGNNVLHALGAVDQEGCTVCSVNSDARLLADAKAPCKIKLGEGVTYGLGAGGDPSLGAKLARESEASFIRAFESCDLAVFVAGLGGGTGSGALPVMAKLAREKGVFLVSVVAMPFDFEGDRRREQAESALESISLYSDIVMVFENDWMGTLLKENGLALDVFAAANKLMARAVAFVPRLVRSSGLLHLGLDDLKSALSGKNHRCLFGCGEGVGDAREVCSSIFDSPLIKQGKGIPSGSDVLVHVSGGSGLTFSKVQEILRELASRLPGDVRTHMGVSVSDSPADVVEVVLFSSMEEVPRAKVVNPSLPPQREAEPEKKETMKEEAVSVVKPHEVHSPVAATPVQIITMPIDPVDEIVPSVDVSNDQEEAQEEEREWETEVARPEMGEDHLILEERYDEEDDEPEAPPIQVKAKPSVKVAAQESVKVSAKPKPLEKKSLPLTDSSSAGKGRFDGDTPFIVDGEDLDLPPSMRKKS